MGDLGWDREFALEQAGGDTALLEELLGLLCQSARDDLTKIEAGLRAGDAEGVGGAAHSIKGASASLGVEGLRLAAYDIEKKAREGQLALVETALLQDLVSQLPSLRA